ncbi:sulfurtransferase TusA family protein [Maritalea mediterranea]|uniref:Sulfurtransferase TusA family protein n=1 Tax=Maritalea mediterranea TaxID=2909667 RepID=A0ABS9E9C2_9HYPH|nr:sulfurtransferase TusA family protein [Maritalea mediterranea]MCF4099437.1 sulfurtransferase TusA family protein [Maritalea mediterranea]
MSARLVDTRGLNCPLPVIKAEKALAEMPAGQAITLLATDPLAEIDIPNMCNKQGFTLAEHSNEDGVIRFIIQK